MTKILHKIFNAIWVQEKTLKDWARMLVTPIHKKGDKLDPANHRAISFLSIPGKVFSRILLNRMKLKTEETTDESQFSFKPGRGTLDAIFIFAIFVRQVIEKAQEHHVQGLVENYDRNRQRPQIVLIIESLYNETECAVVIDGQ